MQLRCTSKLQGKGLKQLPKKVLGKGTKAIKNGIRHISSEGIGKSAKGVGKKLTTGIKKQV